MPPTSTRSRFAVLALLCFVLSATFGAQNLASDLTAHEWGTFTSIAGRDGQAVKWWPLNGSTDLPGFVQHFHSGDYKAGLRGTVRMETPVIYFYSPHETAVSVKVRFSKGVITEWYPNASHIEPDPQNFLEPQALFQRNINGSIAWNSVTVSPDLAASFPHDNRGKQYYAARETSAAPLVVKTETGNQQEKFLFYRGVSVFPPPISATVSPEGALHVTNLASDEVPSVILFERRGDKVGYRLGGALPGEMSLDPPDLTSTFESLSRDLEDILTSQGLYPDEARAMIATWHDSWFEEGSRLFYIVPTAFVNTILPLTIHPAPSQTVRVFVGRLELVTPATTRAMEKILATHDADALHKYNRFLEPILEQMKAANPAKSQQIERDLELTYSSPQPQPPK
jgi:hypothetical protein